MYSDSINSKIIELNQEVELEEGVCFDPERISLEGIYKDELSAYRAKRVWIEVLESIFLLDNKHDLSFITGEYCGDRYFLSCQFVTACARYAFWRLTNQQSPEAQYMIETAHIPDCEMRQDDFLYAPDLRPICNTPEILLSQIEEVTSINRFWSKLFRKLFR
ncbi:MAG: hypothetical protein KDD56_00165 [Bdellovibrionales bacterium]|nr:hypothetical protein [Bdellovibrionales bacterium]